ncbi:MAG TPA: MlaD family protein [Gemmatimonadaceae bacterium]|jgi:phospholipid/cholesterol/gamma-HCH transport system substrate-binding protein|nr:MlaD family protein [Gemmatimonadaceae bacterium]
MKRSSFVTWEQLKVGVVILAALGVLAIAIYKLGQAANLFHRRYELIAYLPNATGLVPGGTVLVAGQFAGTIKSIDFLPVDNDTTRNLRLRMAIDASLRDQIRSDSKAKVRTLGLLGDKVIDISIGTPRYGVLREGDTIAVSPSLDYEAVLAQAAGAVNDMVDLTHDLRALTTGILGGKGTVGQLMTNRALYDQFVGTMSRANTMLTKLQNPNGTFARLLDDPTLYSRFISVVTSADSLVVSLNDKNGTIGKLLRDDSLYAHFVSMAQAGDSIMKALSNGQGPVARLLNDPTLYDRLNKLTTDLGTILEDVRKDPHRYFRGMICVLNCK